MSFAWGQVMYTFINVLYIDNLFCSVSETSFLLGKEIMTKKSILEESRYFMNILLKTLITAGSFQYDNFLKSGIFAHLEEIYST